MAHLLKWKEPRAVGGFEWQNEGVSESRKLFFLFVKWSVLIGVPVLIATYIWLPQGFLPVFYRLLTTVSLVPLAIILPIWWKGKFGRECYVTKKGLLTTYSDSASFCSWKEIKSYRFDDYVPVCDVRVLKVKIERHGRILEQEFRFSPQDVNESQIEELLRQHLPRTPWASE